MDGWRDKKEDDEWGTRTIWQPKQNKNGAIYSTTGYYGNYRKIRIIGTGIVYLIGRFWGHFHFL